MKNEGFGYFGSVWNYIDIMNPSIIMCIIMMNVLDLKPEPETERML